MRSTIFNSLFLTVIGVAFGPGAAARGQAPAPGDAKKPTAAKTDEKVIRGLIKQLGDDDFTTRETAAKRLQAIGVVALEFVRETSRTANDAEVRQRADLLYKRIVSEVLREVAVYKGHFGVPFPWATRVAATPDGKQLVSCGFDGVRLWDRDTGKGNLILADPDTRKSRFALGLSGDGRRALVGRSDGTVSVLDLVAGRELLQFAGHRGEVWGAVLSRDGSRGVTGGWDGAIHVWNAKDGTRVRTFPNLGDKIRCLALHPDGRLLAAAHVRDNQPAVLRLYDLDDGQETSALAGHEKEITVVAFSPDGKRLLSSSFDGTIRHWDVAKSKELHCLRGHVSWVEGVAFCPDGQRALSCGLDGTFRLWDLRRGLELLCTEPAQGGYLSVAILPDGRHAVTTGKDGMVRLWRLDL